MLERDIADKLYSQAVKRYSEERPDIKLSNEMMNTIWFSIYGIVCRDDEKAAAEYVSSAKLLDANCK